MLRLGIVAHAFNPGTQRAEASMNYIVNFHDIQAYRKRPWMAHGTVKGIALLRQP